MTDHANELRRYSRKIGHPAGDVPSVMLAAAEEIERMAARLEAAEKSDAESIAMYRKARDERDALRVELNEIRYGVAVTHDTIKALRAKVETAENDAAHQKALAASALRVAEGWERKCGELRAKITEMEKQEPIGTTGGMPGTTGFTMACFHADKVPIGSKLYTLPGAKG